jgi:5-methylcytosine-specific restriction endonuclease McrA
MPRNPNTNDRGEQWTEKDKLEVWNRTGRPVLNKSPNEVRVDKCGFDMHWNEFGNRKATSGWEIDHITPVAKGGKSNIENLQALNWQNNASKSDRTDWSCGD